VALTPDRLKSVPLFSELSDKELKNLAGSMRERTFAEGDVVTQEGEQGVGFFVIDEGEAQVSVDGEARRTLGPGDHFGEIALLAKRPRTATIVATTELRCYGLTAWQFRPLVESDAGIAWKLLQGLAASIS
jgi:CRP-like cAMP-binding protein